MLALEQNEWKVLDRSCVVHVNVGTRCTEHVMDPMDPHDDWTSPAATTMRSFFRILLLSVRSPSQSTHPGTDLLAYSSCFSIF